MVVGRLVSTVFRNIFPIQWVSRIPPWVYLIILAFITFGDQQIIIPSDLKLYSCRALNIFTGLGYTDIDGTTVLSRGPLFPILLAIGYWFFGISHESNFIVIRFFCILNPIVVYALGKQLVSKQVGFSAAMLVLNILFAEQRILPPFRCRLALFCCSVYLLLS